MRRSSTSSVREHKKTEAGNPFRAAVDIPYRAAADIPCPAAYSLAADNPDQAAANPAVHNPGQEQAGIHWPAVRIPVQVQADSPGTADHKQVVRVSPAAETVQVPEPVQVPAGQAGPAPQQEAEFRNSHKTFRRYRLLRN